MPSEDGKLYRWDLAGNTLNQVVTVNPTGIGEAYVPTLEGPDGTVYTIENAQLYAVGGLSGGLSVTLTSVQNPTLYGGTATFNAATRELTIPEMPDHGSFIRAYRQAAGGILVSRILHQSMLSERHVIDKESRRQPQFPSRECE